MTTSATVQLLRAWRDGADQQAAEAFLARYADRLVVRVRRHISAKLGRRIDAEDVVQSACHSFLVRVREKTIDVETADDFWKLLVRIAFRKLFSQAEFHTAGKRSITQEESVHPEDAEGPSPAEPAVPEPDSPEWVALTEELEHVLNGFEPVHRRIIELHLLGHTQEEIAGQTDRTDRTVRNVLKQFEKEVARRLAATG